MSQNMVKMGLVGALLLGASACAPAEQSQMATLDAHSADMQMAIDDGRIAEQVGSLQNALTVDASALSEYEALVANKPVADAGTRFAIQEHMPSTQVKAPVQISKDFSLKVEAPKSDYVLGEPVILQVTLTNTSDKALQAAPLLDVVFDHFKVEVVTPDGAKRPFNSMIHACTNPKVALETFEPGESFTNDVKIFAPKGGWMFAQPGDYTINMALNGMSAEARKVVAEPIDLTVLAGNAHDRAAADLIMDGQAALLLDYRDGDQYERGIQDLKTIVNDYPNTIHALYAGHVLGNMAGSEFMRLEGPRPADYGKAISYLEPVFNRLMKGDVVVAPDMVAGVSQKLAESYAAKGKVQEARQTLTAFLAKFGSDPLMSRGLNEARAMLTEL